MKGQLIVLLGLLLSFSMHAQIGGKYTFNLVGLSQSSRVASLGGVLPMISDRDPLQTLANPALLSKKHDYSAALSYINYVSDINMGAALFAKTLKGKRGDSLTSIAGSVQYIDYGTFTRTDPSGNKLGNFTAGEYAFGVSVSRVLSKRITGGVTSRFMVSNLDQKHSTAISFDIGGAYTSKDSAFDAGLLFRNVGTQITSYNGMREPLATDIQLGFAYKLKNAPLRLIAGLHHLNIPKLAFIDTTSGTNNLLGEAPSEQKVKLSEHIFRHLTIGTEFVLSKNLFVRIGYNHMRRKELSIPSRRGFVGFSGGLGFRVNRFQLSYGQAVYHLAGASHTFSVSTDLRGWKRNQD